MIRFAEFEANGPLVAGITESKDGDFSLPQIQLSGCKGLSTLLGVSVRSIQLVSQVHGDQIVDASGNPGVCILGEADGIATDLGAVALGIRVADCVPVFLYAPSRRCGALVHAGREGTRHGIVGQAVNRLNHEFGAETRSLMALIGPSAGPCCYEVSTELARDCQNDGLRVSGRMVDLWTSNADQLARAGIPAANIDLTRICTICSGSFHSFRRDKSRQRNLAVLML